MFLCWWRFNCSGAVITANTVYARAAFSMDEKEAEQNCSLRNEKLKVNRASETEGQRKEMLKIRNEKDRARRRTKKLQEENKRSDSIQHCS